MRVLVTGASGFLGRHVLDALLRHGIDTVAVGRRRPELHPTVDFLATDLLTEPDFAPLLAEARATHLLHLSWYTEHSLYRTSPLNLRWVEATTRLVEAFCVAGGSRVVVAGTCAEYDWSHGWCREDETPLAPTTLYGIAKDATRRLTAAVAAAHGVPLAWGRVFLPHGAGEAETRLIPSLIDVFSGRRAPFEVDTTAFRDFLHADDVAEAFLALTTTEATGAFNISSGQPVMLESVVEVIARLLGGRAGDVLALSAPRPGEPPLLAGQNMKLRSLGWRPTLSLTKGLARSIGERAERRAEGPPCIVEGGRLS